jgi:hypothetical protein
MKIEVNIDKKYLIILIGVFVLVVGGIFVYAQANGGVSHAWSELTGKPDISNCAGNNQALKTINLETGAVTCEVDDAGGGGSSSGGGGLSSVSWDDITGKPIFYKIDGKIYTFTNSFFRENRCVYKVEGYARGWAITIILQARFKNGVLESRIITKSHCGNSDSGWKAGGYSINYQIAKFYKGSHCDSSYSPRTGTVGVDKYPFAINFTSDIRAGTGDKFAAECYVNLDD